MTKHIYMPERLYVSNIVSFCNLSTEELHAEIMNNAIESIYADINWIRSCAEDGKSVLTYTFLKEAKKLEIIYKDYQNNKKAKNNDYFLLRYYNILKNIVNKIENDGDSVRGIHSEGKSDIDIICGFEKSLKYIVGTHNAEVVSEKSLNELIKPYGKPYKKKQVCLVKHLLNDVLPRVLSNNNSVLFDYLETKSYEKIFLYCAESGNQILFWDSRNEEDILGKQLIKQKLDKLRSLNRKSFEQIGSELCSLYDIIVKSYSQGYLCNCFRSSSQEENSLQNINTEISKEYDSIISSYILDFLNKISINLPQQKDYSVLLLVENVIEIIRPDILSLIESASIKELTDNNIFLDVNYSVLRKDLIDALYDKGVFKDFVRDYVNSILMEASSE